MRRLHCTGGEPALGKRPFLEFTISTPKRQRQVEPAGKQLRLFWPWQLAQAGKGLCAYEPGRASAQRVVIAHNTTALSSLPCMHGHLAILHLREFLACQWQNLMLISMLPFEPASITAGLDQPGNPYQEAGMDEALAQPKMPALPGSPPSAGLSARKRSRPSKFSSPGISPRFKLPAGGPRVAHPECTPLPDQAAEEASASSPLVQAAGQSPTLSSLARKRGRPKGAGRSTSNTPVLLSGSPSDVGALTHLGGADAAGESSPGSQVARKRGRPKGSRNAPVGEWFLICSHPPHPLETAMLPSDLQLIPRLVPEGPSEQAVPHIGHATYAI